jgi:bifunctional UDP-N-acetylglucosamine pyrophosphorylase/glucosamine-1-phosphate N-acetyltransferase
MEKDAVAIVLAAGEGTRMKSKKCKVMHKVCGYPLIQHVLRAALEATQLPPVVVVGHKAQEVQDYLGQQVRYAYQAERLGTGHAVMVAKHHLKDMGGYAIVLAGDVPLIRGCTLKQMIEYASNGGYDAVALSAILDDPEGYGRIIRDENGDFEKVVEHKDATAEEQQIKEINASIYCFDIQLLLNSLNKLDNQNVQGEYYLTDVLGIMKNEGYRVGVQVAQNAAELLGVNTRVQLAEVEQIMRHRINLFHMEQGVTIMDPNNTYIDSCVTIGEDTIVYPGNVLEGNTVIDEECILYPNNRIVNSNIGKGTCIQASVILDSQIGQGTNVGPYAFIRPGSIIGDNVRIGDFVEIKNSSIGDGSKVSHLTYVGDGSIGRDVNVGCGVVFVNYDGEKKRRSVVKDRAFIGCNVNLIAPVEVKEGAYIAAGSTITEDVPEKALAIARARQVNKDGWVEQRLKKKGEGEK